MAKQVSVNVVIEVLNNGKTSIMWPNGEKTTLDHIPYAVSIERQRQGFTCGHCKRRITNEDLGVHLTKCDPTKARRERLVREEAAGVPEKIRGLLKELEDE